MRDRTRLKKALRAARASEWEWGAALILLSANGIDNALSYVSGLRKTDKVGDDPGEDPPGPIQLVLPFIR